MLQSMASPAHLIYSIGFNFQPHDSISPGGTAQRAEDAEHGPACAQQLPSWERAAQDSVHGLAL